MAVRGIVGYELRRSFRGRAFRVSLAISLGISFAQLASVSLQYGLSDTWEAWRTGAYGTPPGVWCSWMGATSYSTWSAVFYFLLPLLACIPHAWTLCSDLGGGLAGNLLSRSDVRAYLAAKAISSCATASVVVVVPQLANLFGAMLLVPLIDPDPLAGIYPIGPMSALPDLFYGCPLAYVVVYLLIGALVMSALVLASLVVVFYTRRRFVALVLPLALNVALGLLLYGLGLARYTPTDVINPAQPWVGTDLWVVAAVLLAAGLALFAFFKRQADHLEVLG